MQGGKSIGFILTMEEFGISPIVNTHVYIGAGQGPGKYPILAAVMKLGSHVGTVQVTTYIMSTVVIPLRY